ncbi:peptidase T [Anaerococcus sp.]|uniref:peptidase T n=1 Tax=Anaerococcus sp. TaxID=1872515 RepID=UPI002590A6F1|nr:peptidase T [Anaerococcus sp.]MDU1829543.1 peptidase T [Anaerococcus sp.]MDU1863953.1 peptidase T [Anaerococcus sp.]MDU3211311.1 peptidase T [Anaerococcus sp.]
MEKVIERFLKYISYDTKSDPQNGEKEKPSSKGQWDLAKALKSELEKLGLDASINDECFVFSEIKSNTDKKLPTVGFIAHMDTSPEMDGKIENPQIIDYKGGDIKLNDKRSITVNDFPVLKDLVGLTLITTRGETLLGADDKAGIAAIMNMAEYFINNPKIEHGDIKIAFTPDEEIGTGADTFDIEYFDADFAYTIDGGYLGELEYETFNAASAKVNINGKSVHPGSAKDTMVNSTSVAFEFDRLLGEFKRPEHTECYDGFYHLVSIEGDVENTKMEYIIRDHDRDKFESMKKQVILNKEYLNNKYGDIVSVNIKDSYYNMGEILKDKPEIIDYAKEAMENLGIKVITSPVRGGTDGSKLSFMGLPCPNIFAGGLNFHGVYEILPVEFLIKSSETIIEIVKVIAKNS